MKQTVYIASSESQQIHVWSFEADSKLTLAQVVDALGQIQPMVVSPNEEYLYVGVRPELHVLAYRVTPDNGALTFVGEATLLDSPIHISIDRHGRFVFSASYNQGCVSVTPLQDGLPGETVTVVEGLESCHSANISPDNRTLQVSALKQDRICLFTLSEDGFLSAQEPAEVTTVEGAGPHHMVFHPNQQYGYYVDELNSFVDVWELKDPNGNIECVQTLDMMPQDLTGVRQAADIHIIPDGRHLYACDRTASIITVLSVSEDGSVLTVEGYQPAETQPHGLNLDHNGKYLITAGQKSHHIAVYEIEGEQGLLHERGRYAVGQRPMWVAVNAH